MVNIWIYWLDYNCCGQASVCEGDEGREGVGEVVVIIIVA